MSTDAAIRRKNLRQADERYNAYKFLCDRQNVMPQWHRWQTHYIALREQAGIPDIPVTERNHYRRYWLRRFTPAEIRDLAGSIDFLDVDHSSVAGLRRHPGERQAA